LSVNHCGIVVIVAADVILSPIAVADQPNIFELVCIRVVTGRFAAIVVVLYRPDSATVLQKFYDEMAAIFDRFATRQEPIYVVGDFNIRLDPLPKSSACYGLLLHPTGPTRQA
jgi:hypothetical protein